MSKYREALAIAGAFLAFGAVWVLFSDRLLLSWIDDPQQLSQFQTLKGWVFVFIAAVLMFYLVNVAIERANRLLEANRRYEAFFSNSAEAIWHLILRKPMPVNLVPQEQVDWVYKYAFFKECNDAFAKSRGLKSGDEIIGQSAVQVFRRRENVNFEIHEAYPYGGYHVVKGEVSVVDEDGRQRSYVTTSFGLIDGDCIRDLWGFQTDITALKETEKSLLRSEQRYRSIVEDQTEFVVRWRADGRLLFVNDSYCRLLGKPREILLGSSFFPHIHPDDLGQFQEMIRALEPKNPVAEPYEERVVLPCGDTRWTQWIDRAIFDTPGGEVEYQSVGRDITDLKRTELALKQAKQEVERLKDRLLEENDYLKQEIKTEHGFEEIIGRSQAINDVLKKVKQVAPTDATVLIQGESGTGKELIARAIHNLSARREQPLVKVNCGAISPGVIESELFGHEKGAFTGAHQRRSGRFELSNGGTMFLDEIGELSEEVQIKLLRVLQEKEFERVGSNTSIQVDVRMIVATNRDLAKMVQDGAFRRDLYYRLNVFPVQVPPLRERASDIPMLVEFFVEQFAKQLGKSLKGVSKGAMKALVGYAWPGNIRELRNVIERAAIVAHRPILEFDDSFVSMKEQGGSDRERTEPQTLQEVERRHILKVLEQTSWIIAGKRGAATVLGIHPNTLRSRMQKLGIRRSM